MKRHSVIPGFSLTLGCTLLYVSIIVILPLSLLFYQATSLEGSRFWKIVTDERVLASYRVSFGTSLMAACLNAGFGLLLAWVLVRYRFPGRKLVDSLIDLPFALPTAVAGIALTTLYAEGGWIGQVLERFGVKVAFTPLGIIVALTFIGLPFVVRTVQPVLEEVEVHTEEVAASLGANRWQIFRRVIAPQLVPALLTGVSLAFARALGEYGSVVFISGNMPMKTEITPLLIMSKLEQFDYAGATALAAVLLIASFLILLMVNIIQWRLTRYRTAR